MKGRWVRYKLFYQRDVVSVDTFEDGWCYEYLPSYYPEEYQDKTDWLKAFREYICDGRTYTCEIQEIGIEQVPKEVSRVKRQHMEASIWRKEKHLKLLKKELGRYK